MIQEELTGPGLSTEGESPADRPFDLVRVAVQSILLLYLSPVIVVVAAIGLTAVVCQWLARSTSKVVGRLHPDRPITISRSVRAIGSRPLVVIRRNRHRAIR